jgi:hypothetical protein
MSPNCLNRVDDRPLKIKRFTFEVEGHVASIHDSDSEWMVRISCAWVRMQGPNGTFHVRSLFKAK